MMAARAAPRRRVQSVALLVCMMGVLPAVAALDHARSTLATQQRTSQGKGIGRLLRATGRQHEHTRLSLRGGGIPPPVIPLVAVVGGTSLALKLNEDLRGRVLKLVEDLQRKIPGRKGNKQRAKVVIPAGYDVRNGTWAYEVNDITPGCLLVASPDTFRFAGPRQVLDQSVILLVRHGKSGSSGFIINRPTQFDVGDVTKKLAAFEQNPLYLGGDIGEGVYMVILACWHILFANSRNEACVGSMPGVG